MFPQNSSSRGQVLVTFENSSFKGRVFILNIIMFVTLNSGNEQIPTNEQWEM